MRKGPPKQPLCGSWTGLLPVTGHPLLASLAESCVASTVTSVGFGYADPLAGSVMSLRAAQAALRAGFATLGIT